ncbi:MAG: hypothetical protein EBS90_13665 [Betaproteobacteria bacterium]|nr:hypothetical protein [Betaproteobacteria bacterium]
MFVTTSTFTRDAVDYAAQIDTKIVLVDGRTLARLMTLHEVGCAPAMTFVVTKNSTPTTSSRSKLPGRPFRAPSIPS